MRLGDEAAWPNSVYDFESYDDNIFKPSSSQLASKRRIKQIKRPRTVTDVDFTKIFSRQNSEPIPTDPDIPATSHDMSSSSTSSLIGSSSLILSPTQPSSAITIPSKVRGFRKSDNVYSSSFGALNIDRKINLYIDVVI